MSTSATITEQKTDIRTLTYSRLKEIVQEMGEPTFRADQLYEWLWQKRAEEFSGMTNLSKPFRQQLEQHYTIRPVEFETVQHSRDRTVKVRFRLYDDNLIEGVLIPAEPTPHDESKGDFDRVTACISSQVGCSLNCKFCATGFLKRQRNVEAAEIFDQVYLLNQLAEKTYGRGLTNIVFMGMGEPLLNYKNVLRANKLISSEKGLNISPRRITVSTVGIAKMIKKLADDQVPFHVALSLHAATNEKRNQIMPINKQNSLSTLKNALKYFYEEMGRKITYEYILLKDFNDTREDAKALARFTDVVPSKINIIEYNPIAEADFEPASEAKLSAFIQELVRQGAYASVRRSRGQDIDAACGQLANRNTSKG